MRILMFSCVLWLAAGHVAAADLYAELNRLRAGDGRCTSSARLPPLRPQAALDQAARNLARGDALERSLAAAGYRAARSSFFTISGEGAGARGRIACEPRRLQANHGCRLDRRWDPR